MLTDTKLRNLKPEDKLYKVNDRDGLYEEIGAVKYDVVRDQFQRSALDDSERTDETKNSI